MHDDDDSNERKGWKDNNDGNQNIDVKDNKDDKNEDWDNDSSAMNFDAKEYQARKAKEKRLSVICMIGGGSILLNSYAPIPIPLVGIPAFFVGGVVLLIGIQLWSSYKRLPLHSAVLLARQQDGIITRTDIFLSFGLSPEQTDKLLSELVAEGFLEVVCSELQAEEDLEYRLIK